MDNQQAETNQPKTSVLYTYTDAYDDKHSGLTLAEAKAMQEDDRSYDMEGTYEAESTDDAPGYEEVNDRLEAATEAMNPVTPAPSVEVITKDVVDTNDDNEGTIITIPSTALVVSTSDERAPVELHKPRTPWVGTKHRLIPDRTLAHIGSKPGQLSTTHLEDIRDRLVKLEEKQRPRDIDRSFNQLHVDFRGGRVTGQFIGPEGLEGEPMLIHKNAYEQMTSSQQASQLMPGSLGRNLLATAGLDEHGEGAATAMWALWRRGNERPRTFRIIDIQDPSTGDIVPMIRSQHSQGYADYGNLRFVQEILDNSPELRNQPVLDFKQTDLGMRMRISTDGIDRIELNKPIPLIEAWNSEVGRRHVVLTYLLWKLICTNGMGTWDKSQEFKWRHFGSGSRISQGVESAIRELRTSASGAVAAYDDALGITINNAMMFIDAQLSNMGASKTQIKLAQEGLNHPTTSPNSTLASATDAVALIAQDFDLFEQASLEQMAGRMLANGRALANNGRILVEA